MKTYRDKNGFEINQGENWNDKMSDETIKHMTDPNRKMTKHIVDTLDKFENEDPMTTWVKKNNANNENPGTFKKLVKQDEKDFKDQRGKRFINKSLKPAERNDNPKSVAFNPTTQLFTNKDRTIAFQTYDEADTWNKAIGIKTEPKPYPTQATPEQVGKLAERLERNAQMTGGKGPLSRAAKEQSPFIKHRQKLGDVIRNQKDKKVVLLNNTKPIKFEISPILSKEYFKPAKLDPKTEALGRKIFAEAEKNKQEKIRIANSGLARLMGEIKFDE